jgi:glycosyltransferase involved in cell wall biosynthesis
MAPPVTVAIACYNYAVFLPDAIGSVLGQSQPVNEIIVVDDGSTDETAHVVAMHPRIIYHYQENRGLSSARNAALERARGERILFLDADDLLLPNAIKDASAALDRLAGAAFAYGGYREISTSRMPLFDVLPAVFPDAFEGLLRSNHIAMHGTVLYDTAVLRRSGGFDETLHSCEDYDVYLRLSRRYPIAVYSSLAAEYRRHAANMTGNSINMIRTVRKVLFRHLRAGTLTPAQRHAGREGLRRMTGFYAEAALRDIRLSVSRGRLADALTILIGGLRADPRFTGRLLSAAAKAISRSAARP